jgi:CRISPR-associated protein Cmr6
VTRPLYRSAVDQPEYRPPEGHAGLWFDKFCNCWLVQAGQWSLSTPAGPNGVSPKLRWIQTLTSGGPVGDLPLIEESSLRLSQLVESRAGRFAVYTTESRFVTGMGRTHPIENGFAWHPTLGTPYLPGSSIKGMVRAWVRTWGGKTAAETIDHLFGGPRSVGEICFMDAVPVQRVKLDADIMTPHYAGWDESDPPGDWRSPTPIPFLVAAERTRFLFGVFPRHGKPMGELDLVFEWLTSALEWTGAGAKTAVGYGRMAYDRSATDRLGEQLRKALNQRRSERLSRLAPGASAQQPRASLSPLQLELEDLAREQADLDSYLVWLKALESQRWASEPGQEKAVAALIKAEMENDGKWKPESRRKKPEKDRDYQRTLVVMRFLTEVK